MPVVRTFRAANLRTQWQSSIGNAFDSRRHLRKLIIPGERQEDFDALLNNLLEEYSPETPDVRNLVEDLAPAR